MLTFPTRRLWEAHEFSQHRVDRTWTCSECPRSFAVPDQWRKHLEDNHQTHFNDSQYEIVANMAEQRKTQATESLQCPLCLCIPGKSRRNFVTHVGKHMESIALAALPRENASESESDQDSATSIQTDINESRAVDSLNILDEVVDDEEAVRCICGHDEYPGPPALEEDSKEGIKDSSEIEFITEADYTEDLAGFFLQCDMCKVWQHGGCVGIKNEDMSPEEYFCEQCRKDLHKIFTAPNG
jgi:hypothetical protein